MIGAFLWASKNGKQAVVHDDDASWFGVTGGGPDSVFDRLVAADTKAGYESDGHGAEGGFIRIYRAFLAARMAIGLALLASHLFVVFAGARAPQWSLTLTLAYCTQTTLLWLLPRYSQKAGLQDFARLWSQQWLSTIGLDILVFSLLRAFETSASLNFAALLVLPVLMAGTLSPRLLALATTAFVALILLGFAGMAGARGSDMTLVLMQAGLAGGGLFLMVLLVNELASRLARESLAARGSMELARQQAQLNRLVIDEMQEGVLVVDRRGRVRAANPAARTLLAVRNMVHEAPFRLYGSAQWQPLVHLVEKAFSEKSWSPMRPEDGHDVTLALSADVERTLRVRMRFTRHKETRANEDYCVLLLEDMRSVQARSRQESLAAMGRVSAGIAHEIRNPLSAIAQANDLLAEELQDPTQLRLAHMIADNVGRLKRIVDDVMELAPGAVVQAAEMNVTEFVRQVCADWAQTNQVSFGRTGLLKLHIRPRPSDASSEAQNTDLLARIDPDHLRRVLINLLDNAYRHLDRREALRAMRVWLLPRSGGWLNLVVANRGQAITPDVQRHLFEPFYSTRSRGTGLGLYICRELCERYGGRIEYRCKPQDESAMNEFVVTLRRSDTRAENRPTATGNL